MIEIAEATKRCSRCKNEKQLTSFHRETGRKDGLSYWCKTCQSERQKVYRDANPEKRKAAMRSWYECNREYALQQKREWYQENREAVLEAKKNLDPVVARARRRAYREKYPDRVKESDRRQGIQRYGITVDEYDRWFAKQEGACAICRRPCASGRRLSVDHCHETGTVRGLLCGKCNTAIGLLEDNTDLMRAAIDYLDG